MTETTDFELLFDRILAAVEGVDGWMENRELELLALLAAYPTTEGAVLEIGSYRGRSTIALALAAAHAGDPKITAVDPMPDTGPMAPDDAGRPSARALLSKNLERAGVSHSVEFHQKLSSDLAPAWNRPLRLLWIDGDHEYAGVKLDVELYLPHLANGAVVAFHDILQGYSGPMRVFADEVLASPHFGPAGFVGSIGWAQYFDDPALAAPYRPRNKLLRRYLLRLSGHATSDAQAGWLQRRLLRLQRARIPHGRVPAKRWIKSMTPNYVAKSRQRRWSPPLVMSRRGTGKDGPPQS